MEGPAIARWVKRHSQQERFEATMALMDAAIEEARRRAMAENPNATPRDVRAYIRRLRHG